MNFIPGQISFVAAAKKSCISYEIGPGDRTGSFKQDCPEKKSMFSLIYKRLLILGNPYSFKLIMSSIQQPAVSSTSISSHTFCFLRVLHKLVLSSNIYRERNQIVFDY